MNALLTYFIESSFLLVGVLAGYQWIKKTSPYLLLRSWLLIGFIAVAVFPFLEVISLPQNQMFTISLPVVDLSAAPASGAESAHSFSWLHLILILYAVGAIASLSRLLIGLYSIYQLVKKAESKSQDRNLIWIISDQVKMPFSFGPYLFWNAKWQFSKQEKAMILEHESMHISQKHTIDILISGLLKSIFWFHPAFHWMERELKLIHEYEADESTLHQYQRKDYLKMLFNHVSRARFMLGHSVYQSPIQKRIKMMKLKQNRYWQVSRIIPAVLLVGSLALFVACTETEVISEPERIDQALNIPPPPPPPPPPVVEKMEGFAKADAEGVFQVVEEMPRFPGCEEFEQEEREQCAQKALLNYVYQNIKYPEAAKKSNVEGMVVVSFIVDEKGRINDPTIVRNIGAGTGEEVIRVVNKMNEDNIRWTPGKQRGRQVKVRFNLPVKFALD